MFCPKCGIADQKENSYCRKCGEFLPDLNKITKNSFGGDTPQENVRSISSLSLIASVVSLLVAISMYATNHSVPFVLHLAAAVLLCNAFWNLSNFYVVRKLAARLNQKRDYTGEQQILPENKSDSSQMKLPKADTNEFITPDSITENTTRKLKTEN
ncbi:MAG: hypothetical protein WA584_03835 [Pyrinomonadaceae bacterium]